MNSDIDIFTIKFNDTISDPEMKTKIFNFLSKNDKENYYVKQKKMNKDNKNYEKYKIYTNEYIKNRCKKDEEFHERIKAQAREKTKRYYEKNHN